MYERRTIERFFAKTVRRDSGCLDWTGHVRATGYGVVRIRGRIRAVHRVAWEIAHGPVPDGLCVCHHCDNRRCVEVEHLWLGTNQENTADKVEKGRQARQPGESNAVARLTNEDVLAIRALVAAGALQREVALQFGITQPMVSMIVSRRCWSHLP